MLKSGILLAAFSLPLQAAITEKGSRLIDLTLYDTLPEITEACNGELACAELYGNFCKVHILRPQIGYQNDWYVAMHEIWHCYFGAYH